MFNDKFAKNRFEFRMMNVPQQRIRTFSTIFVCCLIFCAFSFVGSIFFASATFSQEREITKRSNAAPKQSEANTSKEFAKVRQLMKRVQERFARLDTSNGGQAEQMEIISRLEGLLASQENSAQTDKKNKKSEKNKQETTNAGNKSTKEQGGINQGKNSQNADRIGPKSVANGIWGHLPEKLRNEMKNVGFVRFLPKYEDLIRDYYKRLAEQGPMPK